MSTGTKPFYLMLHLRPLLLVGVFPWIVVALSGAMLGRPPGWTQGLGLALVVGGLALLVPAHWQIYKPAQWTVQQSSFEEPNGLVTSGAYGLLRHPQLMGIYLILAGEVLVFASPWLALYALLIVGITARSARRFEEPRLQARFGEAYGDYAKKTKRFFPGVF